MRHKLQVMKAFKVAFPYTIPILMGFTFLGIAYGMYMRVLGFPAIYPIAMSILIFGGSMEFIAAGLLLSTFSPLGTLLLTLVVHARHVFYGISMIEKYKNVGIKKLYLIFGLCDETFSVNYSMVIPEGVDKGWVYFWVTLLDQVYWVVGTSIGALAGVFIGNNVKGLDFVMTALFTVIFLENWMKEKSHFSSLLGIAVTLVSLLILKSSQFLLPALLCMLAVLSLMRSKLDKEVEE